MITVREVIVVEGRYDKNTLRQVVNATVIETGGFAVFSDAEKRALLRRLADERGLIIMTDSDSAGFLIRNRLKGCIPPDKLKHAYIPDIYGREARKSSPSKEGKLGVEGMRPDVILQALRRAGATMTESGEGAQVPAGDEITKADMFALGLSGGKNSAERRRALQKALNLPERMTSGALLEVLNILLTRAELTELMARRPE
ncbi:MAG: DUF4093 domain-containing protein [Oscillospiraceae bacterium]|nr:DUF4093 domain-containing protein [Oscillospiraceae bacterium]